jgi:predicted transcriptional regulator of viral defense system
MPISADERERRFILCRVLVDILKPTDIDKGTTANERLVAYCVGLSTFGPHPMGLNKIAEAAGLPRSTVRAVLHKLCKKGWTEKNGEGAYNITLTFMASAEEGMALTSKYRIIKAAAEALIVLGGA